MIEKTSKQKSQLPTRERLPPSLPRVTVCNSHANRGVVSVVNNGIHRGQPSGTVYPKSVQYNPFDTQRQKKHVINRACGSPPPAAIEGQKASNKEALEGLIYLFF